MSNTNKSKTVMLDRLNTVQQERCQIQVNVEKSEEGK